MVITIFKEDLKKGMFLMKICIFDPGLISKKRSSTYLIETDDQQKITAQEVSSQQQTQIGGGY